MNIRNSFQDLEDAFFTHPPCWDGYENKVKRKETEALYFFGLFSWKYAFDYLELNPKFMTIQTMVYME